MKRVFLLVLCSLCIASNALATTGGTAAPYDDHFRYAAARYAVPYNLLLSIAEHESRLNPWAVNIEGRSYYPKSKEEALALIAKNQGKSYDLGLMQINVWWYKRLGVTPEMVLHPEINIILGAYILGESIAVWDLTWKAVAAYHTPPDKNPTRAVDYAKRIWSIYKKKG